MSPCQLPSALRRMVLTVFRNRARLDVLPQRSQQANLWGP